MFILENIPPWGPRQTNRYLKTYVRVLENIKRSALQRYPGEKILIVDITNRSMDQITALVHKHGCGVNILYSVLDNPAPWHWVKYQIELQHPDKVFRYVGHLSHDIDIMFWPLLAGNEFPQYQEQEVVLTDPKYLFLSYNFKPHEHRTRLIDLLKQRQLLDLGFWTLDQTNHQPMGDQGLEQNLGSLDIWRCHFLNITSETLFKINNEPAALGEKIMKPIVGLRPWIINGSPNYYEQVRKAGFDCFEDIFPVAKLEQQHDTLDHTMTHCHNAICDVVEQLQQDNLLALYQKLLPRLRYNRDQFYVLAQQLKLKCELNLLEF